MGVIEAFCCTEWYDWWAGPPLQYTQGFGLISCIDLTGEPCVLSVMTEFAIRTFLFPAHHQPSPKPCMAQTLGRDAVVTSGLFTACRPTFGGQRHPLPTWRPIQEHFFS